MEYKKDESECKVWDTTMGLFVQEFWNENGMLEGERKQWYEDEQIESQDFWRDGRPEGERKFWYKNGQLQLREFYWNGRLEGKYQSFSRNGYPLFLRFYENGQIEGESRTWNHDGSIHAHRFFENNRQTDVHFSFHKRRGLLQIKNKLCRMIKRSSSVQDFLIFDLFQTMFDFE